MLTGHVFAPTALQVGAIGIALVAAFILFLYPLICLWTTKTPGTAAAPANPANATGQLKVIPTPAPVSTVPDQTQVTGIRM